METDHGILRVKVSNSLHTTVLYHLHSFHLFTLAILHLVCQICFPFLSCFYHVILNV